MITIPVLYVLSIGPVEAYAVKALVKGSISAETYETIGDYYLPLSYVEGKSPLMRRALDDYVKWWFKITGTQ
jgi:hypothetical protein